MRTTAAGWEAAATRVHLAHMLQRTLLTTNSISTLDSYGSSMSTISADADLTLALPQRKKSKSPPKMDDSGSSGGFTFIIGDTPGAFKSKKTMTIVRKKAMDSFLKTDKPKKNRSGVSTERARLNSEASDISQSSNGSFVHVAQAPSAQSTQKDNNSSSDRRQKSPAMLNTSTSQRASISHPSSQLIRRQRPDGAILDPPPIIRPSRTDTVLLFDISEPPQLNSVGESLDPFRTMYQSSHPHVSVTELKFHCSRYFGSWALGRHWIPACLEHPHTFLSTLCLASAHHDVIYGKPVDSLETAALRQDIIHMVGENLLNPEKSVQDHNIIAVSQLIISDIILRKQADLAWHEAGMEKMIKQRGGLATLGVNGLLASAVSWANLTSAILREAEPRPMYLDYSKKNADANYPPTATIPESPIYSPRDSFYTLKRSAKCKPRTLDLLNDIRTMIGFFLQETKFSRRNSNSLVNLYTRITSEYPSVSQLRKTNVLTEDDWKYEAVRITAVVQATAIIKRIPLSKALLCTAPPRKPSTAYTSSLGSISTDSLFSTLEQGTPSTEYSVSPTFSAPGVSPTVLQNGFPFDAPSMAHTTAQPSAEAQRPSFSSTHSNSSGMLWFPPAPAAAPNRATTLLKELKEALEMSNLSDCWADMAGVLLWVGLVMGAASNKCENKMLAKYYSATTMRAAIMLCFEHTKAMHATTLRMMEVVDALGAQGEADVAKQGSSSVVKRRKA